MKDYCTILDTWEGQGEINEAELLAGGITGMIIRINDTAGGLHKDAGFDKQWNEAQSFYPAPYFVYNPWVSGQANYTWLVQNMPQCPALFVDIELVEAGTSPAAFGVQFNAFINMCKARWRTKIYTGAWFLPNLTPWPKDLDYWWAAYPYSMYPSTRINVTWAQLRSMTDALVWPVWNVNSCPGMIKMWQCSGDRLIVPGTTRAMDVSVFPGSVQDYAAWLGYNAPPAPVLSLEQRVVRLEKLHGF